MKDFLARFEELATKYPDVAITVAIVLALGLAVILNLYGKALKEQIASLKEQKSGLESENSRLRDELSKVSEYRETFEQKLEQLQKAQLELAAYSDFEIQLETAQRDIKHKIDMLSQEEHDAEVLRDLQQESSRLQDLSFRYKKFQEGLRETVQAAENLSNNKELWVNNAVDDYLRARRRKKRWWNRVLPSASRRR